MKQIFYSSLTKPSFKIKMKATIREEVKNLIDKKEGFVLINVLSEESFKRAHIKGSINIPIQNKDFEKKATKKIPDNYELRTQRGSN